MKMTKSLYGKTADGKDVFSFTIKNESGAEIELLNYGATLNKISVPDRNGDFADVLVGFDTMEGQLSCTDSQGRTVGRVANRISGNGITIDGKNYRITKTSTVNSPFTVITNTKTPFGIMKYSATTALNSHISAPTATRASRQAFKMKSPSRLPTKTRSKYTMTADPTARLR